MSRRKLKGERELIADIKKRQKVYCDEQECCKQCKLSVGDDSCEVKYVKMLFGELGGEE